MGAAQTQGVVTDIPLQHPYLRNCRAITKNKITFLLASVVTQKPQYQKWKEQLFEFQGQNKDNDPENDWLLTPLIHKFEAGGVCSTSGELKLQYEYYPKLLSAQIAERALQKRKFNQPQLWYLLYVLVAARQSLVLQGYQCGDLQPRNVFLNANQQAKVGCILSWPGQVSAYRKVVLEQDFGYLAPQDIERLKLGAMDNKNNTESQIFAIGLTMLSASSLQTMKDLYRIKQRDLDQQLFSARVSAFQQDRVYSDIFRAVVSNLLEINAVKRMNQEELYQFLSKHKQSLINKKPLMFDNVGRKLQESINQLLRLVPHLPRLLAHPNPPPIQKQLPQHPNVQHKDIPQHNLKNSSSKSIQKRSSAVGNEINPPVSPRNVVQPVVIHNLSFNQSGPFHYQQYPIPLPHPPKSLYPIPQQKNIPNPTPININSQNRQSPQKYRPFQTLSNAQSNKGEITFNRVNPAHSPRQQIINPKAQQRDVPSAKDSRINELKSDCEEKSIVRELNLLMETRRGFNVVEVVQVKRKQKGNESRVSETNKLDEHSIIKNSKESELIIQKKVSEQKESHQDHTIEIQHLQPQARKETLLESPRFKEPSVIVQKQQIEPQIEIKKQIQPKDSIGSIPLQSVEKIVIQHTASPNTKPLNNKQEAQLGSKFSPLIKVWGMQKGQLTVQQVTKSPLANSHTQRVAETNQRVTVTEHIKQHNYSEKSAKSAAGSEKVHKETVQSEKESKSQSSEENLKEQKKETQNYILIEQLSHSTEKQEKELSQKHVQSAPSHQHIGAASEAQSIRSISAAQAKNRFMYVEIATDSSFEECWAELEHMIDAPALYCPKVNPEKVIPRITEYGRFLKIGPARVKIDFSKENGKVWLQNIYGSKCEGEILCGVLKGKDMRHYIWFNSSYTYKGLHFPSRQVLDQALLVAKSNLDRKANTSQQTL